MVDLKCVTLNEIVRLRDDVSFFCFLDAGDTERNENYFLEQMIL